MKIVITIEVPEGVQVAVSAPTNGAEAAYVPPFHDELVPLPDGVIPLPGDVTPAPFRAMATQQPMARTLGVGEVHLQGHKPLKLNNRGIYCPTKLGVDPSGKDIWCPWRP